MTPEEQLLFRAILTLSCCALAVGAIWIGMGSWMNYNSKRQLRKEKNKPQKPRNT